MAHPLKTNRELIGERYLLQQRIQKLKKSEAKRRETAEKALREVAGEYKLLTELMTDIVWIQDMNLRTVYVSPSIKPALGFTPEERMAQDIKAQLTPSSMASVADLMAKELALEQTGPADLHRTVTIEVEYYHRDGSVRWFENIITGIRDENGILTGIHGVSRNIAKRRQIEEALRKSEEKYRGILENMRDAYYEVDLKGNLVFFNDAVIVATGYSREELMGMNYRQYISHETCKSVSMVYSQIYRTGEHAASFEYEVITKSGQTKNFESWVGLLYDDNHQPIGFRGIARDVTDRKKAEQQLFQTLESLRRAIGTTIQVMVSTVEARDPYTAGHQLRVADLAGAIAAEMGLSQEKIEGIRMAGTIHDIGKLFIPTEILSKPAKLSDIEFSLIKEHPRKGYEILKDVESPWPLAEIVYQHHERMDGSGYPRNLKGEEILIEACIMAVADVVEAMSSHRPYRPGLGTDKALDEIEKNRGTLYDGAIVDACLTLFRNKGFQFQNT
jgi:PAS domain S-box-containing protein/putative nucleotidyltransferase with HDIG domain